MTVTIPLEVIVGVGILLFISLWGLVVSIKKGDWSCLATGVFLGTLFGGIVGVGVYLERDGIENSKLLKDKQDEAIAALSPEWQQFQKKMAAIVEIPIKRTYVKRFLQSETPPKISETDFKTIYTNDNCSRGVNICAKWEWWLTEQLMPFVILEILNAD